MTPQLGWIDPLERTKEQREAHDRAVAAMPNFALAPVNAGPVKVMLTDWWKNPAVVADVGSEFTGFHQLTGSCVGASEGNAIFTLAAIQRTLAENPTKAFVPWWPFPYGRSRLHSGFRGQGEGSIDSVMADTLVKEGVIAATEDGLPRFNNKDGLTLTSSIEYAWSDGASKTVTAWLDEARVHPLGAAAPLSDVEQIKTAIINGYPVLDGCSRYVGHGSIRGSGDNAYVNGRFDSRGGHSTCVLAYWDHPNDGPLYGYSNQWPASVYPKDPAGLGRCCVWLTEAEMKNLFRYGGGNGETIALSHLNWFPAQPSILDWSQI